MDLNLEDKYIIHTGNLCFRKPCVEDIGELVEVKNDEEAALLLGGVHHQYTAGDIKKWIDFHNAQEDEAVFVIIDSDTNHIIGHVGIYKIDKRSRKAEYGILIGSKNARGRGYGTMITNAMVKYAFSVLGLHKIKALVLKENLTSYHMFKKCGFVDEGVLRDENFKNGRYYDVIVMSKFEDVYR